MTGFAVPVSGMGRYSLYRCPKCLRARSVLAGVRTVLCNFCSERFKVGGLPELYSTDSVDEAVEMVGRLNSELVGRTDEFLNAVKEAGGSAAATRSPGSFDTPHQHAAFLIGRISGNRKKIEAAARHLTDILGEFTRDDLDTCLREANADTDRVDRYIEEMAMANLLQYLGNGRYRYIE